MTEQTLFLRTPSIIKRKKFCHLRTALSSPSTLLPGTFCMFTLGFRTPEFGPPDLSIYWCNNICGAHLVRFRASNNLNVYLIAKNLIFRAQLQLRHLPLVCWCVHLSHQSYTFRCKYTRDRHLGGQIAIAIKTKYKHATNRNVRFWHLSPLPHPIWFGGWYFYQ